MDTPPVQYVTTSDGYSLAYAVSGQGRPLVIVPTTPNHVGLLWRMKSQGKTLAELAARYQIIQYDGRGQGQSTRGLPDDFSVQDIVQDCETVVRHLRLDRFCLLGAHIAGQVAIRYAVKHPEEVEALILWHTPITRRDSIPPPLDELAEQNPDMFAETFARMGMPFEDPAEAVELIQASLTVRDFLIRSRALNEGIEEIAKRVTVPTLVIEIQGTSEYSFFNYGKMSIASLIPGAKQVTFKGATLGLFGLPGETPPAIAAIEDFINGLPVKTPNGTPGLRLVHGLSQRELEVLRLIAAGESNQQIADELVISINTVGRHVSNIFDKTGAANRAEATAYAMRHGLA